MSAVLLNILAVTATRFLEMKRDLAPTEDGLHQSIRHATVLKL